MTDKEKQKNLLMEMMQEDEKNGMYEPENNSLNYRDMINVITGYCAVRIGRYWMGLNKNGHSGKYRRTPERALKDVTN